MVRSEKVLSRKRRSKAAPEAPVTYYVVAWNREKQAIDYGKRLPTDDFALLLSTSLPRIGERIVLPDRRQFEVMQVLHRVKPSPDERAKNPPPKTIMGYRTRDVSQPLFRGESQKCRVVRVSVAVMEIPRGRAGVLKGRSS
jgi:hypothetical protein